METGGRGPHGRRAQRAGSAGAGDPGEPEVVGGQRLLGVRVQYAGSGVRSPWCAGMSLGHS